MKTLSVSVAPLLLVALAACAGASSGEATPEATASATAEPSATASASADPAASATSSSTAAASASTATPAPKRAAATLKGKISGKDFTASGACLAGSTKPGTGYIEIYDAKGDAKGACGVLPSDKGALKIGIDVSWKAGDKLDVATIAPKGKEPSALFVMERVSEKKVERKDAGKDFKPTGSIEVLEAPGKDGVGRIKLTIKTGKDVLEGEVDVEVKAEIAK